MKLVRFAIAGALALLAAACLPVTTKTAVGTTAGFKNDPAVMGLWSGKTDGERDTVSYFHFIANKDGTTSLVGATPAHGIEEGSWGAFKLTMTTLGAHRYMNANQWLDDGKPVTPEEQAVIVPLLYTVKADTLTIYLLDDSKVQEAIVAHRIEGEFKKHKTGTMELTDIVLTSAGAKLDTFLSAPDAARYFRPFLVLKRMK